MNGISLNPCTTASLCIIIALIAAVLGFGGFAGAAVEIAKIVLPWCCF